MLTRYHEGWGRPGDAGVIAELDGVPVGAAWYRLFTADEPGYGFVDEKIPELGIAVEPLHRRKGIGGDAAAGAHVQAREEGFPALSLSVAAHNRSRMMYQRVGFEKVGEDDGGSWTMVVKLVACAARARILGPRLGRLGSRSRGAACAIHQPTPPSEQHAAIAHATAG